MWLRNHRISGARILAPPGGTTAQKFSGWKILGKRLGVRQLVRDRKYIGCRKLGEDVHVFSRDVNIQPTNYRG